MLYNVDKIIQLLIMGPHEKRDLNEWSNGGWIYINIIYGLPIYLTGLVCLFLFYFIIIFILYVWYWEIVTLCGIHDVPRFLELY